MQFVQNVYDTTILPLYREVATARSIRRKKDDKGEDVFVIIKKLRETSLYTIHKAYHKPAAYSDHTGNEPCMLKRFTPEATTIIIRTKNSKGIGGRTKYTSSAQTERGIMNKLHESPFVQKMLDVFIKEESLQRENLTETWLKFEYTKLGSLSDVVKASDATPTLIQVAAIGAQLLSALEFIHSKEIIHGELTSKNVLLFFPGFIKISNFALAIDVPENGSEEYHSDGPLFYTAPEKLLRHTAEVNGGDDYKEVMYDHRIDIYSFGILLLEMFLKAPPLHRACAESPDLQDRFVKFICDIASPQRNKGSLLYHLFYPHYDLVKEQVQAEIKLDSDVLKDALPQLEKGPTDPLIVLMGYKDEKERYKAPNAKDATAMPRFKKMFRLSSCFDLIRQSLFVNYKERPTAEELVEHNFVKMACKEVKDLHPEMDEMKVMYKSRAGRKALWEDKKTSQSVRPVFDFIKQSGIEAKNL